MKIVHRSRGHSTIHDQHLVLSERSLDLVVFLNDYFKAILKNAPTSDCLFSCGRFFSSLKRRSFHST